MSQQRKNAGLRVVTRKDNGALTIVGTINGQRIRKAAESNNPKLAKEEAALLEGQLFHRAWHGERRGDRLFSEAALSYLDAKPRSANQKAKINRLALALGDPPLREIDQQTAIRLKRKMLRADASPRAYVDAIIMPLRAILTYAAKRLKWCELPDFEVPQTTQGRTLYLLPGQVDRLIAAAAPHLRPLLTFLVGTGARMAEALELDWRDVDLQGARAIFWKTKNGKRRNVELRPAVVAALANLAHREGKVFSWQDRAGRVRDYADRERRCGGQIKTAWKGALKRAGLSADYHPHDLRHTWASWHYATHRDVLRLKIEGGWSTVALVERYAHLLPAGHKTAIADFWHETGTSPAAEALSA